MPVLIIAALLFFLIFPVMGVMAFSAMASEQKGQLFSWRWADVPKRAQTK